MRYAYAKVKGKGGAEGGAKKKLDVSKFAALNLGLSRGPSDHVKGSLTKD
jgi:hypothetical protein